MIKFRDKTFETSYAVKVEGSQLWMSFISTFCLHYTQLCPKRLAYKWSIFLRSRNGLVGSSRNTSRIEALKSLFFRTAHIPSRLSVTVTKKADRKESKLDNHSLFMKPNRPWSLEEIELAYNTGSWYQASSRPIVDRNWRRHNLVDSKDSDFEEKIIAGKTRCHPQYGRGSTKTDQKLEDSQSFS